MSYLLEDDSATRHAMAIGHYEREIKDLNDARRVHLTEDDESRLDKEDTPRVLAVAVAAKHQHEVWLRLCRR